MGRSGYNRRVKPLKLIVPLTLVLFAACQKNIQTNDAVRQAVLNHLSQNKGLQIGSMDIEVAGVTFKDNEAEATVSFKPKGGGAGSGMEMRYSLEKKDGAWVVKKKADSGMGHGMAMPGGMPAPAPGGMGGAAMPPNHPSMGAAKEAGGPTAAPKK